ncbi:YdeI/OmpD-associated family protein [Paenibacillus sp. OV219]|uniref:YdeI/OmpD-associated family protein n=1 Tax=Paenibacillus sp. OV219 TaxID=1884377 RepID=UPI0008B1A6CE|nr:YdeI/OmpD-associated family protein [Paenibacillus sp. OV219]SEM69349.1 Bacteriocin-protection, YdeI or OmpD-Associated [Paenibacillus sp. OV219]
MNAELVNKLRFSLDMRAVVMEVPEPELLEELGLEKSGKVDEMDSGTFDFVMLFVKDIASLNEHAPKALKAVKKDGLLWICYPKGTSKMRTDINRDRGWRVVKDEGWEGVSLVSINETWSAMRFRPVGVAQTSARASRAADLSRRTEPVSKEIVVPDDVQAALASYPEAEAFFAQLATSHRKEYIRWINEAKQEVTRVKRIMEMTEKLSNKLKRPSDKPVTK